MMRAVAAGSALAAIVGGLASGAPAAAAAAPAASQPVLVLLGDHVARSAPYRHAPRLGTVAGRRPLTRVRTALPIVEGAPGARWARVRLPGRPNEHTGWVRTERTRRTSTEWHVVVRQGSRRVTVYRDGRAARRFLSVVGHPTTPTPRGRFFVEEALTLPAGAAGGPFALALSARSPVLQWFAGGPGQIALHGTRGLVGARGTAVSHGCIRLSTRAIEWLALRVAGGVPVTVTR